MSSGEEFQATSYDVKLEDVIVKQNDDLLALQELLETRSRKLADLQEKLDCQSNLVKELDNSLFQQNSIIHILNSDLKTKDLSINKVRNEMVQLMKTLGEVTEEKDSLAIQLQNLEKDVKEKNSLLEKREECIAQMKHVMEATETTFAEQATAAAERENILQLEHENKTKDLENKLSAQLKNHAEKSAFIEAFLEQQIEVLFNRLKTFFDKGLLADFDFNDCKKEYYEKIRELKLLVTQAREGVLSDTFINEVKDLSSALPGWLSQEAALEDKLNSQTQKLEKTEEELKKSKQACDSSIKLGKELEAKLNELNIQVQIIQKEKLQLQQHLLAANNNYEKMTKNLNRDRVEMEKKYQQSIDSYELDMDVLIKSLDCLLSCIPKYFVFEENKCYRIPDETYPILFKVNPDTILNTNVCNAHHLVYKCLCEIENHCSKARQVYNNSRSLEIAFDVQKRSLEEKTKHLEHALEELKFIKQNFSSVEDDRKFIQNKLMFVMEENMSYITNIELLNLQILDLKKKVENYQSEISLLTEEIRSSREEESRKEIVKECCECQQVEAAPSKENSFISPAKDSSLPYCLTTSTPLYQPTLQFDSKGAGDATHPSTLKWMEKYQALEKENKYLTSKVSNLEIYNRDLKFTINRVREEMNIFKDKQSNLEEKLGKFISLKKQCEVLIEESEMKDLTIENISKELQHLKNENIELFNNNVKQEELLKNNENKLFLDNDGSLQLPAANRLYNEKVKETISLKHELCSKEAEKKSLLFKVDFLQQTNKSYEEKLKKLSGQLHSAQEELEKAIEEKLQFLSENKLLKKEFELLELRVQYFSSLSEKTADSKKLVDEIVGDLVGLFDYSVQVPGDHGDGNPDVNVQQLVTTLNDQLSSERILFLEKVQQLQMLINTALESGGEVSEDLLTGVDKLCRSIGEDHKYYTTRLQQALTSLAPFLAPKSISDQIDAVKSIVDKCQLEEEIKEKNKLIEVLQAENESLRTEVVEQRKKAQDLELEVNKTARAVKRERNFVALQNSQKQVVEELSALMQTESYRDLLGKARELADAEYQCAVERLKLFIQEDSSNRLLEQQFLHEQQVKKLEEIITEQAIQIRLLGEEKKKLINQEGREQDFSFLKEDLQRELSQVLSGVRAVHQAELAVARLQFTYPKAESLENTEKPLKPRKENFSLLLSQLLTAFHGDFTFRLKNFLHFWHPSYVSKMLEIENQIKSKQDELTQAKVVTSGALEKSLDAYIDQYEVNLDLSLDFLNDLKEEYKQTLFKLEECVNMYVPMTESCFEKLNLTHINQSKLLKLWDEASRLKEEATQLKNLHCEAVEVVRGVMEKVVGAVEAVTESEPSAVLASRLTAEHRAELNHLTNYYVQMCSNLEKQYAEDVHSLQSKVASMSSSDQTLSLEIGPSSLPIVEVEFAKGLSEQCFSSEQIKYIENLKRNWSEELNEFKNHLESKYARKMKDVQHVLSTYIYKNELDICARCLKDVVMMDCEAEIKEIEEEFSRRAHDLDCNTQNLSPSCQNTEVSLVTFPQPSFNSDPIHFTDGVTFLDLLKSQKINLTIINEFILNMKNNLSLIDNKLMDKENRLVTIQNKLNCISHSVFKNNSEFRENLDSHNENIKPIGNHQPLLEMVFEHILNEKFSKSELEELFNLIIKKIQKTCDTSSESITDRFNFHDQDKKLNIVFPSEFCIEDYERLMKERDSLKEMTSTLKSAVNQLVMYLGTCEDELNKTVVDELVKICADSPARSTNLTPRRVHFAPQVEDPDESQDLSLSLRMQLDSCLAKLKMEAASLLGLTALHPPPANLLNQVENLQKENKELREEVAELKIHIDKCQNCRFEIGEEVFSNEFFQKESLLDRVQCLISSSDSLSPNILNMLNELAKFGDRIISELRKEVIDLQQQFSAADKQLKSTRQFLEEQTQERESERDDFNNEVKHLQEQLKEINRQCNSQQLFSAQLQQIELQLSETRADLEDSEKEKDTIKNELKDAIEKIWVLRDIISDLEAQLCRKSEKEELLERKLDQLEAELDHHSDTQIAMAQELESLRGQSMEESYLEQIKQLQENIKVQFDSSVIRSIKVQIREMELSLERRSKELENLYLTYSNNSVSSPSEEVSVVEQLEVSRNKSPEESLSPLALPVQDLLRLQEKINRHATVEQVMIKRFRDMQLSCSKLNVQLEEMQAERDVIQKQMKKQMVQLAESNNKIDDLRHRVEIAQTTANRDLIMEVQELKQKYSLSEKAFVSLQSELGETRDQLLHAEEIIEKQQTDMQKLSDSNHQLIQTLRIDLASVTKEKNKLENLLIKQNQEIHLDVMSALLADKNEDIDRLQLTVSQLQSQEAGGKHSPHNSKGLKISYVSDLEGVSPIPDDMKLRDSSYHPSFQFEVSKVGSHELSTIGSFEKPQVELDTPPPPVADEQPLMTSICSTAEDNLDITLLIKLKSELEEKSKKIVALEKEIEYLKSVKCDLSSTKSELEAVLSSISNDKNYYESHFKSLNEEIDCKNEEIETLKKLMSNMESELIKKKADVTALEEISQNLQIKLKEATNLAVEEDYVLKENIKQKQQEIENLNIELVAYKNDLSDEKELADTLKSSLNILTREKSQLEDKVSLFEVENRNLSRAIQAADDKLSHYSIVIKNLKNYLLSKQTEAPNRNKSAESNNSEDNDLVELKTEINKIISINEQLNSERLLFLEEIEELKSNLLGSDCKEREIGMGQLKDELIELRKAIGDIKKEKLTFFSNFSSEIEQLNKDIVALNESKQELIDQLRFELSEKKNLHDKYSKLLHEVETMNSHKEQDGHKKKTDLSFCDISIMSILPGDSLSGMDALAEQLKNELQLSKNLDNALLRTIEAEGSNLLSGSSSLLVNHDINNIEKALNGEIRRCKDTKKVLAEKIEKCHHLEIENSQLRVKINRLERLVISQNEKVSQLSNQVDLQKEKIINLELTVMREQSNFKQVSLLLEHEKTKGRETQQEDIGLIETMRKRLQTLMENEIKLKELVLEEKTKSNRLLAQINSMRALEKFTMESNDINNGFEEEKRKYLALKIEYEKERQGREEIQNVLTRERAAISMLKENLSKSEQIHQEMAKELSHLKKNLNEEIVRRQIAETKIADLQDNFDKRLKKYLRNEDTKKQKELDGANTVINKLNREHSILMKKHSDLQLNWREAKEKGGELGQKVRDLQIVVSDLEKEREGLLELMKSMRECLMEKQERRPVVNIEWRVDTRSEVLSELEAHLKALTVAEWQRKALIFQKQYLLVTLRGYHCPRLQLYPQRRRNHSLKSVVWAVIAAHKIQRLPFIRLLRFHKKKDMALEKLKSILFASEVDRLAISSIPERRQIFHHSPPSKDLRFY